MNKRRLLLLSFLFFLFSFLIYVVIPPRIPLSPLGIPSPTRNTEYNIRYTILGFAPYWNRTKISKEAMDSITDYAYFALLLDSKGKLYTHVNRREQEPGYTNYLRLLSEPRTDYPPITLTFMPESQAALTSILNNSVYRNQAISTVSSLLQEASASGVNIDFEPLGDTPPSLRDNFTTFVKDLRASLKLSDQNVTPNLSLSVYPSAASRPRIWDLASLDPYLDSLVVMTYDYTLPGSSSVGPNSPLRGAGSLFEHDIVKNIAEITALVDSHKILLGIPFYGYEWDVETSEKYAPSESRGSVASLERIDQMIKDKTLELLWDRSSLTPYAVKRENGEVVSQIYYENVDSIRLKLELVKQANLGGIAIWALGYEGSNSQSNQIWQTIQTLNEQ